MCVTLRLPEKESEGFNLGISSCYLEDQTPWLSNILVLKELYAKLRLLNFRKNQI